MNSRVRTVDQSTPTPSSGRLDFWVDGVPVPVRVKVCARCAAIYPVELETRHVSFHKVWES